MGKMYERYIYYLRRRNLNVRFMFKNVCYQTLLRHGANPDLRDEDGKTPLDKARERGHSEVVAILQSPGECSL